MLICMHYVLKVNVTPKKSCPSPVLLSECRIEAEMEKQLLPRLAPLRSRPRRDSAWSDKASVAALLHLTGPVGRRQQRQQQLSIMVEHVQIFVSARVFCRDTKLRQGRARWPHPSLALSRSLSLNLSLFLSGQAGPLNRESMIFHIGSKSRLEFQSSHLIWFYPVNPRPLVCMCANKTDRRTDGWMEAGQPECETGAAFGGLSGPVGLKILLYMSLCLLEVMNGLIT